MFNECSKLRLVKINNNISYNLIEELQKCNKNARIVDQYGKDIPDININYQRTFSHDFKMNNFNINNIQNSYNSMNNF